MRHHSSEIEEEIAPFTNINAERISPARQRCCCRTACCRKCDADCDEFEFVIKKHFTDNRKTYWKIAMIIKWTIFIMLILFFIALMCLFTYMWFHDFKV
jgi:hypothetical protein